jgi:hypothetical protein
MQRLIKSDEDEDEDEDGDGDEAAMKNYLRVGLQDWRMLLPVFSSSICTCHSRL